MDEFTNDVGPNIPVAEGVDVFLTIFTPRIISEIVKQTNKYAEACRGVVNDDDGDDAVPRTTDEEEIKAYIGITILMGINRLPKHYDYWSTDPALHNFVIASCISCHRFEEIKRYLHFVDNDILPKRGEEGYNKLGKVQPIIDEIRQTSLESYKPNKENAIDEAMIKFKGQSTLKQYAPDKPIKRGIKVWMRADSHNGYV